MKKTGFLTSMLFLMTATISLTACSSDDDGNGDGTPVNPPTNVENAAKYEITADNSPYKSIELTAGEEYIVEYKDDNTTVSKAGKRAMAMRKNTGNNDGRYFGLATGKYTKTGDNTYKLDGFGLITVVNDKITIQEGSKTETYSCHKSPKIDGDISSLCRTWKAESYQFTAGEGEKTQINKTFGSFDDFEKYLESMGAGDEDMGYENEIWYKSSCEEMIISSFGTIAMKCKVYFGMKYIGRYFISARWTAVGKNKGAVYSAAADEGNLITFELSGDRLKAYFGDEDEEGFEKLTITYRAK